MILLVALLEEVTRIKARLEAKLQAKQLRKATVKTGAENTQKSSASNSDVGQTTVQDEDSEWGSMLTPVSKRNKAGTPLKGAPQVAPLSLESTDDMVAVALSDMTTPTKTTTPLFSPGFRTPSPPARTRFMSPPSGSSSRKRQHSPSPLPKQPSLSSQGGRYGTSTPSSKRQSRLLKEGSVTPVKAPSWNSAIDAEAVLDSKEPMNSFQDLLDEDLDDAFLDALIDDEDFERLSPAPINGPFSTVPLPNKDKAKDDLSVHSQPTKDVAGDGITEPTLTEIVQAQKRKRETDRLMQSNSRATFYTKRASCEPLSSEESTQLGHTADFDPLTGLRIRDRITTCDDAAKMTRDLRIIPIKDRDRIRENATRRPTTGVLSLSAPNGAASTGRLGSSNTSSTTIGPDGRDWMVAGVIGAKSKQRMTAKKVRYCHFQLCDLRGSVINVFMFRTAMERHHGKLRVGDIVAIMDPKVLSQAEHAGTLGVEVEHPDCLIVIGTSSDFGLCEAVKLNGENCGKILDRRGSIYCNYHIMMATNKRRNQRGSLIAGTSSIYDLEKTPVQAGPTGVLHRIGGVGHSKPPSERARMLAREPKETTYIFDDDGIGTSSMMDYKSPSKGPQQSGDNLSTFLMNQNNPGGQYLRQSKTSKDAAWAKDVTSPKTPTKTTELFPVEMIRRMGYDPVSGKFVPGSPKRLNDDLEARERSLRLLAERVKSPPAPMRPLKDPSSVRQRTIDIKGTMRPIAQPRASKAATPKGGREVQGDIFFSNQPARGSVSESSKSQKWIDLDDGSSGSESDEHKSLLSLSQQRAKNLLESSKRQRQKHCPPPAVGLAGTPKPGMTEATHPPPMLPLGPRAADPVMLTMARKAAPQATSADLLLPRAKAEPEKVLVAKADPLLNPESDVGADTHLHTSAPS
ncbi:hypothetical protein BGZ54_006361, partial [Gamsiella multidivaricata]